LAAFERLLEADLRKSVVRTATQYDELFRGMPLMRRAVRLAFMRPRRDGSADTEERPRDLRRVGRYVYDPRALLGRGGQASVYRARDTSMNREVALKLRDAEGGADSTSARLSTSHREAQLVGGLPSHPGICQPYEAGYENGQVYLAMELVSGMSLKQLLEGSSMDDASEAHRKLRADLKNLGQRSSRHAWLEVFELAARAVQVAHDCRVVHRDLKPANLMINDAGAPVLLDFGAARSLDGSVATMAATGDFVGTWAYMSPEQHSGGKAAEASDVWALGVMLYECLASKHPFAAATPNQTARAIAEHDPIPLRRVLRAAERDLEWVVRTALQKDPASRYASAEALADDLARVRRGEPVQARAPNLRRQAAYWLRRNRVKTAAVVVTFVVGALLWWMDDNAKTAVEASNRDLREVTQFQTEMFERIDIQSAGRSIAELMRDELVRAWTDPSVDPDLASEGLAAYDSATRQVDFTRIARTTFESRLLEPARAQLASRFAARGSAHAQIATALGRDYQRIGLSERACELFESAVESWDGVPNRDPAVLCELLDRLGVERQRQHRYDDALPPLDRAAELAKRELSAENGLVATILSHRAVTLKYMNRMPEALACARDAVARIGRVRSNHSPRLAAVKTTLAQVLRESGEYAEAEPLLREASEVMAEKLGPDSLDLLAVQNSLAALLLDMGRAAEAEPFARRNVEICRRLLSREHPKTLSLTNTLAQCLFQLGQADESAELMRQVFEGYRSMLPARSPEVLLTQAHLGMALGRTGRLEDAVALLRESVEGEVSEHGFSTTDAKNWVTAYAAVAVRSGDAADAMPWLEGAWRELEAAGGVASAIDCSLLTAWIGAALELNRLEEVRAVIGDAPQRAAAVLGPDHPCVATLLVKESEAYWKAGDFDQARARAAAALRAPNLSLPGARDAHVLALCALGAAELSSGDGSGAECTFRAARELAREAWPCDLARPAEIDVLIASALTSQGRWSEAEALLVASLELLSSSRWRVEGAARTCASHLESLYEAWRIREPDSEAEDGLARLRERSGASRPEAPSESKR